MKKTYHTPTIKQIAIKEVEFIAVSIVPGGEADPGKEVLTNHRDWNEINETYWSNEQ